jgi:hypothetical protein
VKESRALAGIAAWWWSDQTTMKRSAILPEEKTTGDYTEILAFQGSLCSTTEIIAILNL